MKPFTPERNLHSPMIRVVALVAHEDVGLAGDVERLGVPCPR
jgi:hypothetical protein